LGVFLKRVNPVFFRAFFVDVKFGFMAFVTFAESKRLPVTGFVNGAFVALWVTETFGENGSVSIFFFKVTLEFS